jgi:hypothetical protein
VDVQVDSTSGIVSVADGCGGIPSRTSAASSKGFRGDEARTPGSSGSGLGPAMPRGLVEAQAGRIEVGNANGGCRFTVRLPGRADHGYRGGPRTSPMPFSVNGCPEPKKLGRSSRRGDDVLHIARPRSAGQLGV